MGIVEELTELLEQVDVPELRKRITPENMRWLSRNLAINNAEHPKFDRTMELVKLLNGAFNAEQ
jgi:hypothetical protein